HAEGVEAEFAVHPLAGLDFSFAGTVLSSKFDSSVISNGSPIEGIRKGNRLPTVPNYQFAATANYEQPFRATGHWSANDSAQGCGWSPAVPQLRPAAAPPAAPATAAAASGDADVPGRFGDRGDGDLPGSTASAAPASSATSGAEGRARKLIRRQ